MSRYRRQEKNYTKVLKDYAVPIIWVLLIFLFIYSIFSGSNTNGVEWITPPVNNEQRSYLVSFNQEDTSAQVIYSWGWREDISEWTQVFFGETVVVQNGTVKLSRWENDSIHLNKIAEFKIDDATKYTLFSSDAWLQLSEASSITMRYANVNTDANSIISLTQNEAWSTIYVLKWSAQVENMVWVETRVVAWQRVSVPRLQASNEDFDISSERGQIDAFFKNSDWFLDNDGHLINFEQSSQDWDTSNEEENENMAWDTSAQLIRFDRLRDEMSIESSSITISGTLLSENIWALSVQNIPAEIDMAWRSFSIDTINLPAAMNDLVLKIYDKDRNILRKEVFTIYTSNPWSLWTTQTSGTSENIVPSRQASTSSTNTFFDVDATKFRFTSPSTNNRFTTTASEITIRWETSAEWIRYVEVNGFRLNSFNGSTWRYHAFERFDTIREGTNQYRIDYLDSDERLVYTDYYTIIKQASWVNTSSSSPTASSPSSPPDQDSSENENEWERSDTESIVPEPEALFWN